MTIRESRLGRLTGHFFAGFLDNDLLTSPQEGMQNLLAQIFGLLAAPGLFWCLLMTMKYGGVRGPVREMLAWEDRLLFVHCAMILTGLVTVIEWDALFPDRRDYQILGPLPITTRLVFLAKVCSVLLLLVSFWAALNAGTALLFPAVALRPGDSLFVLVRHIGAHLLATFAASAFVFLLFTALHGLLLNALPPKWFRRASAYAQLAAMVVLVLLFLMMPVVVGEARRWVRGNDVRMIAIPSYWFLGLYQVLIGRGGPAFSALAGLALKGLAIAFGTSALAYVVSYRRHVTRSLESLEPSCSEPGPFARAVEGALNLFVLRHPLERAHFHFIRATLRQSRIHRLLLAACVGVGFALVLGLLAVFAREAAGGALTPGLLAVQFLLSLLVVCGIRFVFTLPAELQANWIFQMAEPAEKGHCTAGIRKAMLALGVCPVLVVLLPLHVYFWGWGVAAAHLLFGAIVSVLLVEALLLGFGKIPFTCTYLPGKANVKSLWPVYLGAFWAYVYGMAKLESGLLARPAYLTVFCAAIVGMTVAVRWYTGHRFRTGLCFEFEDVPEPAVRTLDLHYGFGAASCPE